MSKRYMAYDGEGIEVGYLTLDEALEQFADARIEQSSGTITVDRDGAGFGEDETDGDE